VTLSGEVVWGRLWGSGASAVRRTPVCLIPREHLPEWTSLAATVTSDRPTGTALAVLEALERKGAMFLQELCRATNLPPSFVEAGLGELVSSGRVTCDSFGGLRMLIVPASRRKAGTAAPGRWSLIAREASEAPSAEFVARQMLRRTGVVFRKTLAREKQPVPWRDVARVLRTLEARGEVRGGRFVAGFDGEQYALPEAVTLLRRLRREGAPSAAVPLTVSAADPLNYRGILTPDEKVAPTTRAQVRVA